MTEVLTFEFLCVLLSAIKSKIFQTLHGELCPVSLMFIWPSDHGKNLNSRVFLTVIKGKIAQALHDESSPVILVLIWPSDHGRNLNTRVLRKNIYCNERQDYSGLVWWIVFSKFSPRMLVLTTNNCNLNSRSQKCQIDQTEKCIFSVTSVQMRVQAW